MFAVLAGVEDVTVHAGQDRSLALLQEALNGLRELASADAGEVVDAVGSELLVVFPEADAALGCARRMQNALHTDPGPGGADLALRVGLHQGPVQRRDGGVFGDTINTAARVRDLAPPRLILATAELRGALRPALAARLTPYDRIEVRGKALPLTLYQVPWQPDDVNRTLSMASVDDPETTFVEFARSGTLRLVIDGCERCVGSSDLPLSVGRGKHCDLTVETSTASRLHCRLEYRRGKFILVDSSTNGTRLVRSDGSEMLLKRESAILTGTGRFALGESPAEHAPSTIHFECC